MTVQWETVDIPLAQGLDTKSDERAAPMDKLSVLENGEFINPGGIQKRNGFTNLGNGISGGGTISNARQIASREDELVLFTKDTIYSYSDKDDNWISRGSYDAVTIAEKSVRDGPTEQKNADRAELSNIIVYVWQESDGTHVRVVDKVSGTAYVEDKNVSTSKNPRVVALTNKILLFNVAVSTLQVLAIDPADIVTSVNAAATAISTVVKTSQEFDVVKTSGTTAAVAFPNTSGEASIIDVTEALVTTTSNTTRTCIGPIALAFEAVGAAKLSVFMYDSANTIKAVILRYPELTLFSAATLDTGAGTVNQIAAAYKDTTDGGYYRAYVFYSTTTSDYATAHATRFNWHDTNSAIGTAALFVNRAMVASRAFLQNGRVYVHLVRWGGIQSTYFLLRHDQLIVAKILTHVAGSEPVASGTLSSVTSIGSNKYKWLAIYRRRVSTGSPGPYYASEYASRGMKDIEIEFDADKARDTVQLGRCLYMPGGMISMYDGDSVVESGFHDWPEEIVLTSPGSGGNLTVDATYSYKVYWEWQNAQGEVEKSTFAEEADFTLSGTQTRIQITVPCLNFTAKQGTRSDPFIAIYRTEANPGFDAPYYKVTSLDPSSGVSTLINDPTTLTTKTFIDVFSDAVLVTKELDYQNGGGLSNVGPAASTVVASGHHRLFLTGFEDRSLVRFSKIRFEDDAVSHNDTQNIVLPQDGDDSPVIAVRTISQSVVIFREHSIYTVAGEGPNNLGVGAYSAPQKLYSDAGCSDGRTIAQIPTGIIFLSSKGFYLLTPSFDVKYIGGPVEAFNSQTFVSADVVEDKHQVRFLTSSGSTVVYDYYVDQWSTWTNPAGLGSTNYKNLYYYVIDLNGGTVLKQTTVWRDVTGGSGPDYGIVVETAWLKLGGMLGHHRLRRIGFLGEHENTHEIRIRVAYDYLDTWVDDEIWTPAPTTNNAPERFRMRISRQKCSAVKIRIEDTSKAGADRLEGLKLTSLSLEIGKKSGIRRLPAVQTE